MTTKTIKKYYTFTLALKEGGFPAIHPDDPTFVGGYYDETEIKKVKGLIFRHTKKLIKNMEFLISDNNDCLSVEQYNNELEANNYEITPNKAELFYFINI